MIDVIKSISSMGIEMLLYSILLTLILLIHFCHIEDLLKADTLLDYEDLVFLSHIHFTCFIPKGSGMSWVIERLNLFFVFHVPQEEKLWRGWLLHKDTDLIHIQTSRSHLFNFWLLIVFAYAKVEILYLQIFFIKLKVPDVTFVPEEYVFIVHGVAVETFDEVFVHVLGVWVAWIKLFVWVNKLLVESIRLLL